MPGRKVFLNHLSPISPYTIGLPNGLEATGVEMGYVSLSPDFTINNVLLIPQLRCNLISISQLFIENKCVITINDNVLLL